MFYMLLNLHIIIFGVCCHFIEKNDNNFILQSPLMDSKLSSMTQKKNPRVHADSQVAFCYLLET